jgi:hypothetical protein
MYTEKDIKDFEFKAANLGLASQRAGYEFGGGATMPNIPKSFNLFDMNRPSSAAAPQSNMPPAAPIQPQVGMPQPNARLANALRNAPVTSAPAVAPAAIPNAAPVSANMPNVAPTAAPATPINPTVVNGIDISKLPKSKQDQILADQAKANDKLKQMPVSVNTAILGNQQALKQIDRTLKLLSGENVEGMIGDKEGTGWKAYLPTKIVDSIDPKGVDVRASIADIGSLKLHDRSGASITASESPRLLPFIPLPTDDPTVAARKLRKFKIELESELRIIKDLYSKDQGYRESNVVNQGVKNIPRYNPETGEIK